MRLSPRTRSGVHAFKTTGEHIKTGKVNAGLAGLTTLGDASRRGRVMLAVFA
jgi:hypothetical protein